MRDTLMGWLLAGDVRFWLRAGNGAHAPLAPAIWTSEKADDYFCACRLPFSNGWDTQMLPVDLHEGDFERKLRELAAPVAMQARSSAALETRAVRLLTDLFKSSPNRSMTNAKLLEWLADQCGEPIQKRMFERAKAAAVRDSGSQEWAAAGRPPAIRG
ncbi:hypothetical protein [Brevundimonas sp.]|uniref:hypothetical protein n=1 Tax=Brevundimonas sp. TaxID=1871086 RepID=UPI003511E220